MNKNIAVTGKGDARPVKNFCNIRDLIVLRFDGVDVRVVYLNGDPWFVAVDVCAALEIVDHKVALRRLDDDEKGECLIPTLGGNQTMRTVCESGFYKLIARSRKATTPGTFAHRFSNWVFRNVIPGIRKTGAYGIPWGALQDFSRRKEQYQISASEKGRELQACKRKKRELEEEEKRLIREYQPEFYFGERIQ
ncbi:antirepressor protein [Salmonella enterica subsp. enterica serovar Newport]|uniref:Antirepressor protein n=1 Tax=Salmonella enterica I TaxID=59201 RepID=A0A3V2P1D7_SALET|nr:antirepressor protein [Salmonella enterica subsp. enterica serovar Newport]EEC4937292.1 antirepressor protein [Salmonella enterica subsp. enterica serovar Kasenyi]EBR9097503.1 antirepressor protein [Salmonella enterica subsp. enterica serovar Newport]EBS3606294.1 antirepressor protein [Salmonella enterica subsp. enterica serovar Newport]EBU7020461.1 antirepressor protein [Salmonella enterica subsp. enterica serovar Newport]